MKKCQSLNRMIKKSLDGCSSTLEFLLVKHIYMYFWSTIIKFSDLTKNVVKNFKLEFLL